MKDIGSFPAIAMIVFVLMAMFGVFVFATFTTSSQDQVGSVDIWGSVDKDIVDRVISEIRDTREDFGDVVYVEVPADELVSTLVEAIAAGRGPDLVFFPSTAIVKDGEKLGALPYASISKRDFQDAFVEAGEVFLRDDGVVALPLIIDPTVMYWNRTLFRDAGIANPPRFWDDLAKMAPSLTEKTPNGSITVSATPLGQWDNVPHAKEVLVSLTRQLGSNIVTQNEKGEYDADLFTTTGSGLSPGVSAVRYIADFSDPVKPMYSWNRSQKNARDAFLAGTLAMYFGPASELLLLRDANPNLNFDVAALPASRGAGKDVSALVVGVAVPRGTDNPQGAALVAVILASPENEKRLAIALTLPSPRRDVVLDSSEDPFLAVFNASALRAFAFLDPNPVETDKIFSRMIENISSGRSTLSDAVRDANNDLQELIRVQ
jgi:ABC-type glycerol-3-phosphate transport system substrate-binding protein